MARNVSARTKQPLWTCPVCGRAFANRNQTHACGRHDLEHHFRGKPPAIRKLYEAFRAMLEEIAPVKVLPEKTRIAFQLRISFAQVTPKQNWLDGHFVLARRAEDPIFRRIESLSPRNHVHHFRIADAADLTGAFRAFAREACAVGRQEHLGR
jgi:hypothetical protein